MAKQKDTGILWCDFTFNPWRGCSKVSPACKNCYAMELVNRFGGDFLGRRVVASESMWKEPLKWNKAAANALPQCSHCQSTNLDQHSSSFVCMDCQTESLFADCIKRPRVFCASLADVFEDWDGQVRDHNGCPLWKCSGIDTWQHQALEGRSDAIMLENCKPLKMDDVRRRLFKLIDATPNLDWLLLTKRPENVLKMWPTWPDGFSADGSGGHGSGSRYIKNVWLGTTVESQEQADKRIPELLNCRDLSPVLFLSCEPLLGPVDLRPALWLEDQYFRLRLDDRFYGFRKPFPTTINWVIVGGESGKEARPMHPDWVEDLRRQCGAARVQFFFKQWGEWLPGTNFGRDEGNYNETSIGTFPESKHDTHRWDEDDCQHEELVSVKVGKKKAGRLLDGKEYSVFPSVKE